MSTLTLGTKSSRQPAWLDKYLSKRSTAAEAVRVIRSGDCVYIHPGCAEPEQLVRAMVARAGELRFVWVRDFPLFEYSTEERRMVSVHHPFTAPHPDDLLGLDKEPLKTRSLAYDLVLNGQEMGGGSIRIHSRELQLKVLEMLGFTREEAIERFGFLLEALSYGAPPHGGIAFGVERLVMMLCGAESIREVMAFPKTQKAVDPMSGAPSEVSARQLSELSIKVVP